MIQDWAREPRDRSGIRAQLVPGALLILSGILAGALWRWLLPFFLRHSDNQEAFFAVEGSLAIIGAVAGFITGILVMIVPGRSPGARTAVVVACLLYTSPSPRDQRGSRMPSSA